MGVWVEASDEVVRGDTGHGVVLEWFVLALEVED